MRTKLFAIRARFSYIEAAGTTKPEDQNCKCGVSQSLASYESIA